MSSRRQPWRKMPRNLAKNLAGVVRVVVDVAKRVKVVRRSQPKVIRSTHQQWMILNWMAKTTNSISASHRGSGQVIAICLPGRKPLVASSTAIFNNAANLRASRLPLVAVVEGEKDDGRSRVEGLTSWVWQDVCPIWTLPPLNSRS